MFYALNYYYLGFSLLIKRNTAATKAIDTKANTPIIMVPFVQETCGKVNKLIY